MSKIRVYELAKELNKTSRDIIAALKKHGINVESHRSLVPDELVDSIRKTFSSDSKPQAAAEPKTKSEAEKPGSHISGRTVARTAAAASVKDIGRGTIDSRGNFVMTSAAAVQEAAPAAKADRVKPAAEPEISRPAEKIIKEENTVHAAAAAAEKEQPAEVKAAPAKEPVSAQPADTAARDNVKADSSIRHDSDTSRRPEADTARRADGDTARRADGSAVRRTEGSPVRRTDGSSARRADGDTVRRADGDTARRPAQNRNYVSRSHDERGSYSGNSEGRSTYNRSADGRSNYTRSADGRPSYNRSSDSDSRNRQGGQARPYNRDNRDRNGAAPGQNRFGTQGGSGNYRQGGQGRPFSKDNHDRTGAAPGQNRQGRHFGPGSAAGKETVPSKDTTRDSRREYKDRDSKKTNRDFEETGSRKNVRGTSSGERAASAHSKDHRKPAPAPRPVQVQEKVSSIELPETITIQELADKMKIPAAQIIKKKFLEGKVYTMNSDLSFEEAEEIAIDYDILCEHETVVNVIEEMLKEDDDTEENLIPRPPVVCVMGHVDHGKTSILDAIRNTHVTSGEAGGITQHIGAYVVKIKGQKITFLDTPGHEAFTAMRLRGAQSTDIAILVVAVDDGVMPQTVEAINHAKAAGIDIIVAINKIDKPGANVDRVKQELMEYDLVAEDWGGKTIMVPVSAHTGEGLDDLLDMILLDAEVLDLKANPNRNGRGLILEAQLDKGRGAVATVLVQKGTLRVGDNVSCGTAYGKIRAMIDEKGKRVKAAPPSTPVEILGLNAVPQSGEVFLATDSEREARSMAETFIATNREKLLQETKSKLSLESLFDQIKEGQIKELNIVVKADVQGSVEAVKQSLTKLSNDEVAVKVIHGGVGAINESDVILASASNAIVIGFNVRPDNQAKTTAEQENVDIRLYRVIYNAIEDIEAAMKGMLEPEFREKIIGHAEVRQTYKVSGIGTIIGGYVLDGQITRSCKARLFRDNVALFDGELGSLKRFKDDVKEVNAGFEFGMSFEKYNDIKEGDQIEAYVMEEIPR